MTAIDQAIRNRAIQDIGTSIALSAGAGSGKTSVLTKRVLSLLAEGIAPDRIAAITFTEKAAGELQARVRDELEAQLAAKSTPVLERALARLPELTLSTIHSFCQQLLNAEALEAGWAPDTEVLPLVIQAEEVDAAYRAWEADFRRRHPVAGLLVRQRINPMTLREGTLRLLSMRDLEPVVDAAPFDPERAHIGLLHVNAELQRAAKGCRAPERDKLLASNRALLDFVRDMAQLDPVDAVVRVLASTLSPKRAGGKQTDWVAGGKDAFLEALKGLEAWRAQQRVALHGLLVRDLHEHFLPAVHHAKASAAVADFDDLLFRAAELLGRDEVRARLADRFDALLIDEVQDTDPIQAEVAALLTRDPALTGPWHQHPPRPGRLFAVGDPRQSIYRFRRADVETWDALREVVSREGADLSLEQNFRSVPGIVEWVNTTFAKLPGYVPQRAHRPPAALEPVVRLVTDEDADAELDAVARHLLALKASGTVVDRDHGEPRPVRWSDVMLLLPAWSKAEDVRATLTRAGIPCAVEGGRKFFARDEVRLGMAALHCLEESSDERSTVLVLRGLFGLDWDALARHKAEGGAWRYTVPDPPPGPVADAFAVLRSLARQRGRISWVALLDELLDHTRAAAVWAVLGDGEARLANLDKLRALVRQLEETARSPGEVIRELDDLARDDDKDLSLVDMDSDAVRITSYFKAKGLEAPVVVLCFTSRRNDSVQAVVDRRMRRVALKIGELVPPAWDDHEDREKTALEAERSRWMYVAATRARDQLVFVDHYKSKLLREHFAAGLARARAVAPHTLPEPAWRDETFPGLDEAVDAWLKQAPEAEQDPTEAWSAARRAAIRNARAASTRWRSVHEVAARERVAEAASPVGVEGGTLIHEVMESLDLGRPLDELLAQVDGLVASLAEGHGLDEKRASTCADIVRGMLRHPVLERARAAPERWVEVPFTIRDQGRVVSGRIDLAFPTDASRRTWVVVDWKSDLPAAGTSGARNYERQLGWYAKAVLRTVSPCEEVETVLVGPHPELGPPPSPAHVLAEVLPELAPGLATLLDRGIPTPRVGAELGEPVVARAELAWDEHRVALCVGQPEAEVEALRGMGWAVVAVDPVGLTWAEDALMAAVRCLGMEASLDVAAE